MPEDRGMRPPWVCRWLLRLGAQVVPARARAAWLKRWDSSLRSLWVLAGRGELAGGVAVSLFQFGCRAWADAFRLRLGPTGLHRAVRGPVLPLAAAAAALLAIAACTHGFAVTRSVVELARHLPPATSSNLADGRYTERVLCYLSPIVLALATGATLVFLRGLPLHRDGWCYWCFLILKTAAVLAIPPLLWIEGGAALRAHIPNRVLGILFGGLILGLAFVAAFVRTLLWSFADQRRRCPVCLRRLSMPVAIGSWASVFEPAATELLCDEGHGSLCVSESRAGGPDSWIALDGSWHDLFEPSLHAQ